jgi:hypothetical protein
MTNARKSVSRGKLSFSTSLALVFSLWLSAVACVKAQKGLQSSASDNNEVPGKELWKFETGG